MEQSEIKHNRPTEEEREKQVLDLYFNKHLSYGQIAHQLRMSLRDVTRVIKKAKGEPVSSSKEENQQLPQPVQPENNFKEIYRRFREGQSPLQVATAMNLRVEYVNEVYLGYLNSIRLSAVVRLFQEEGYEGLEIVRAIAKILKDYKIRPKEYGPIIRFMQNYYDESIDLEELRKKRQTINSDIWTRMPQLAEMNEQKPKLRVEIKDLNSQVEQDRAELTKIQAEAEKLKQTDPRIPVVQLAERRIKEVLQNSQQLMELAVEAAIVSIREDPKKNCLIYPASLSTFQQLAAIPGGIEKVHKGLMQQRVEIAKDLYERLRYKVAQESKIIAKKGTGGMKNNTVGKL
jgi:AraC-like DNA-binding protein